MILELLCQIELRRTLGIEIKGHIKVFVDDEYVLLKKYQPACILCGMQKILVFETNNHVHNFYQECTKRKLNFDNCNEKLITVIFIFALTDERLERYYK